jgi:hypothetical protein
LERAKRNGRTEPNGEDIGTALVTAAASGSFDAIGARFLPGGKAAVGSLISKIGKAFLGEGLTEGAQSLIEQTGQSIGTTSGLDVSGKQALAEGLLGGLTGGVAAGVESAVPSHEHGSAAPAAASTNTPALPAREQTQTDPETSLEEQSSEESVGAVPPEGSDAESLPVEGQGEATSDEPTESGLADVVPPLEEQLAAKKAEFAGMMKRDPMRPLVALEVRDLERRVAEAQRSPVSEEPAAVIPRLDESPTEESIMIPPIPGTPEFEALPIRARSAAQEYARNNEIITSGELKPAETVALRERQKQVVKNFEEFSKSANAEAPPTAPTTTETPATPSPTVAGPQNPSAEPASRRPCRAKA